MFEVCYAQHDLVVGSGSHSFIFDDCVYLLFVKMCVLRV